MKFSLVLTLIGLASATPTPQATAPIIYLCGDSTMATGGGGDGNTAGWGNYLANYITGASVVNKAMGGRSARSFTAEGRFAEVAGLVVPGDVVVIEFGHNDGGSPVNSDNGRSDCPGAGTETCISASTGETVYTFVFYVVQAAKLMLSKGATVVLSSQTPNNLWETGTFAANAAPRFVGYQKTASNALGGIAAGVAFVDHFQAMANAFERLGADSVNVFYPNDHTHTSLAGTDLAAQSFVQAAAEGMNGTSSLQDLIAAGFPVVY